MSQDRFFFSDYKTDLHVKESLLLDTQRMLLIIELFLRKLCYCKLQLKLPSPNLKKIKLQMMPETIKRASSLRRSV